MIATTVPAPGTITVAGTEVFYFDSGDPKGRDDVLVLVHGTAGSTAAHFGYLFPVLAAKQRVISIDWSDVAGERLELDDLVEQVIGVLQHVLEGKPAVLLGYSLGAVVTAVVAARRPELIDRLILVAGWLRTDLQQILRNNVWQALRALDDDAALREYITFCAFGGPFLAGTTREAMAPGMSAMTFDRFGDRQMELNRRIDIQSEVESITAPTLVIGCTQDVMVPIRHQKALFGAISDSRFARIPTGHAVVFERPSELCHHIQRFMDAPDEHAPGTLIPSVMP